jgi:hypothetical protein
MTLCPPTFKRREQLHIAAHTTCDKMFNQWTNNKNRTTCAHKDAGGLQSEWHLTQTCYGVVTVHLRPVLTPHVHSMGQTGFEHSDTHMPAKLVLP